MALREGRSKLAVGLGYLSYFLILYGLSLSAHEVLHLVIKRAMGAQAILVVQEWRFYAVPLKTWGLHVESAPLHPASELASAIGAPSLVALALWLILRKASDAVLRAALMANVLVSLFFASIEGVYGAAEALSGLRLTDPAYGVLQKLMFVGTPEFNLLGIIASAIYAWKRAMPTETK